ncbi:hypothetical protein [Amycolatopsis pithecellobii]|uniref:Uncharacterized protein n=1 Tax=Amycolatopsis pithecellobii TaxID=664692 RepID=A0A6N7YYA8_9PSEU|nr:hypothetical protein [Amycolatopsis pithecellobii]MTD58077.1 hypothetical protein [Amycolatopsis pithecellobii]
MQTTFSRVLVRILAGALLLAASVGVVSFVGPAITFTVNVLYEGSSKAAGVTYEYSGSQYASELYLVEVRSLAGTRYELRIGPHAAEEYYPVEVRFGAGEPRIHVVEWRADSVAVTFESGNSVQVPADNFRSVR